MKTIAIVAVLLFATVAQAAPPLKICANPWSGAMTAKAKCKSSETRLNWYDLQTTLWDACRISNIAVRAESTTGFANGTAMCGEGQVMTTWGYSMSKAAIISLRQAKIERNETGVPVGVSVMTQCDAGAQGYCEDYSLIVSVACCAY